MPAFATYPFGDSYEISDISELEKLYAEKDNGDEDHFGVDLINGDWVLALNSQNVLIWENLADEDSKPRHMKNVPKAKAIELWTKLFYGKIEEVEKEEWLEGYY